MSAFKRDGDRVTLEMSAADYQMMLLALGIAAGNAAKEHGAGGRVMRDWIRLADRINEGHPEWTPYNVAPEKP